MEVLIAELPEDKPRFNKEVRSLNPPRVARTHQEQETEIINMFLKNRSISVDIYAGIQKTLNYYNN